MSRQMIPDATLTRHLAILGMNGSGKTSVAKSQVIEPALAAGKRVCCIDPTGVAWGLRLKKDGKTKGFKIYIVGGERADFPLERRDGAAWAQIVGTSSDSFIFDVSTMTVAARSEWFTAFAEALIRLNKGPLFLILDEAHLFAPQAGATGGGIAPQMLHATNNLLALGRSKGLRITMISQRPAKLHKDSLTQAHALIAMQVNSPQDRAAIRAWIEDQAEEGKGAEIIKSLPSLEPGEGWLWAPREKILERKKFPWPTTFDSSSAPDESDIGEVQLSPIDPAAVTERLATLAKETLANDPAKLRARIAQLEREAKTTPAADPEAIKTAESRGFANGFSDGCATGARIMFEAAFNGTEEIGREIGLAIGTKLQRIHGMLDIPRMPTAKEFKASAPRPAPSAPPRKPSYAKPATPIADGERPLGAERKPLAALAGVYPAGMTEAQWAVAAGLKRSGGTWGAYLSRLRSAGRIREERDLFYATESAIAEIGENIPTMPEPGMPRVDFWIGKISGIGPMLRTLAQVYPGYMTKDRLADELNLAAGGGTFGTYISRLSGAGLIEKDGNSLRAHPDLMQ